MQVRLQEVEEHFSQLVAGVQDYAIFLLDDSGIIASWNAGAQRIKGYRRDEIVGQHFSLFYPPEARAAGFPQHELELAAKTGRFEDEGWRIRKDGSRFWANVVITSLKTEAGHVTGFLKITRDLTERKQAEEALRQSEERFRVVIEGIRDYGLFMLDPEGHVSTWNISAERIEGYTESEVIGRHYACFFPPEEVVARKPQRILETARQHGRSEDTGWRVRRDGTRFWANVIVTTLYDDVQRLRGYAIVTRDLTERRQVEALQHADQQKNQFLAMLAHELRNPLAPIRNGLQLLKMPQLEPAMLQETTEMMERQVIHLVRLVDDLLDVSRIISGKTVLQKMPIELSAAIAQAIDEVEPLMDARGHELMVTLPAQPIVLDADPVRLAQLLSNLLTNAAKYSPRPDRIWLSAQREGDGVVIRVRDHGVGIPPDLLPRIWDLFVQADHSLARESGGLGIGLTLVKRLVELHDGTIDVTSLGQGEGTEFTIHLPVLTMTRSPQRRLSSAVPTSAGPSRRILVVDDNVDAAVTVSRLLQNWGHQVETVYDGYAAVAVARAFQPEIVLLDIGLPGKSGYDVARELRTDPALDGMIIAALTGYGQAEDRQRSRDAGFNYHLIKPPDPSQLETLIASPHSFA